MIGGRQLELEFEMQLASLALGLEMLRPRQ